MTIINADNDSGSEASFGGPAVAAVFGGYPGSSRDRLMELRRLIFEVAAATPGVGALQETLKWGQPSYATAATGSGSPIRLDALSDGAGVALFFHCQTDLVETFRHLYPDTLVFVGNRSITLAGAPDAAQEAALRHCMALALTYHARKRAERRRAPA
jgi:hypothetical protein